MGQSQRELLAVVLIAAIGADLRFYGLEIQSLWSDELGVWLACPGQFVASGFNDTMWGIQPLLTGGPGLMRKKTVFGGYAGKRWTVS